MLDVLQGSRRLAHRFVASGRALVALAGVVVLGIPAPAAAEAAVPGVDAAAAGRFASLALECVHKEYPNKIAHVMVGDADLRPPRELTPAFFGCYDWHSAVHAHWLLARLARMFPAAPFAAPARAALDASLMPQRIAAEVAYLEGPGRVSFERPYGLAWLLMLSAELRDWPDPDARRWAAALEPLEQASARRIAEWLPKLNYPIRVGEHAQTAFAFGLIRDWSQVAGSEAMRMLVDTKSREFHLLDRDCPLAYEPSGQDFLSPCIAEADLMRRVLPSGEFARWLEEFLPHIPADGSTAWLPPAQVSDRADPKLAHLDGLNLSRAWMLEGIASVLADEDPRHVALARTAAEHAAAALPAVTGEHYEGGHWLGTFAVYLVTRAGIR